MMKGNKREESINARLSIFKRNGHFSYILEGTAPGKIESRLPGELVEAIRLVRRSLTGEIGKNEAEKIGLPRGNERFIHQWNKEYINSIGSFIYKNLLPAEISSILRNYGSGYLSLKIDDSLVDIPWELTNDGKDFLCMKYAIGRDIYLEKQKDFDPRSKKEIKFLLLEDPTGTLLASSDEINYLIGRLIALPGVKIRKKGIEMRKKDFLSTLCDGNFDILHFTGHGDFDPAQPKNSCLEFYDHPCYAYEIAGNIGNKAPALIFSNACTSAQTIFGQQGLVNAFLSSGTSTYIGTIWPVEDQLAGMIGEEFYRYIVFGKTVGEALRLARSNSHKKFGWSSLSWAAYILYGDPTLRIFH